MYYYSLNQGYQLIPNCRNVLLTFEQFAIGTLLKKDDKHYYNLGQVSEIETPVKTVCNWCLKGWRMVLQKEVKISRARKEKRQSRRLTKSRISRSRHLLQRRFMITFYDRTGQAKTYIFHFRSDIPFLQQLDIPVHRIQRRIVTCWLTKVPQRVAEVIQTTRNAMTLRRNTLLSLGI